MLPCGRAPERWLEKRPPRPGSCGRRDDRRRRPSGRAGEPVLVMSDDFLRHYHQRSNVESTFSAIKRKFGDFVRARNDVSMVNEALCKCICHNLCCVIMSQIELGIEAVFWKPDDAPRDL